MTAYGGSAAQDAAWTAHDRAYAAWHRARDLHLRLEGRAAALLGLYRDGDPAAYQTWQESERLALRAWTVRQDARDRQARLYAVAYGSPA